MLKSNLLYFVFLILIVGITSCKKDELPPDDQIFIPDGYSLLWSDEFEQSTIDAASWQHQTGDGTDYGLPAGWGNAELQIYTTDPDNSGIMVDEDESVLFIKAVSDGSGGFTSARMTTQNKFSMRFGRIDIKAKLPEGQGIWPAIWMLGDNIDQIDWPGCGEIDIVEVLGHEPSRMYSTAHYVDSAHSHGESQGSYQLTSGTFSSAYHVFSLDWTPDYLRYSVDGFQVHEVTIEADMKEFLRSFYLVVNIAVGGYWPGSPDISTSFPQLMYIDYIRVFEKDGFTAPNPPPLIIEEETIGQPIQPSLAQHAIKDGFNDLGNASVVVYGAGGEPAIAASDIAIDGDSSLAYDFPGGNWGGGYIELETEKDLSSYDTLKFSLSLPALLADAEIKLESPSTNAAIFLANHTGVDVGQGFKEYSIPLSTFAGLDLTQLSIPFAIWNPKDASQNFVAGLVLIDNIYFK